MIILDIENIKLCSINNKFKYKYYLTADYILFKKTICLCVKKIKVAPPYKIDIEVSTSKDIDSFIKPCLDGLESSGIIINDKLVEHLTIKKTTIKRGQPESLKIYLEGLKI